MDKKPDPQAVTSTYGQVHDLAGKDRVRTPPVVSDPWVGKAKKKARKRR